MSETKHTKGPWAASDDQDREVGEPIEIVVDARDSYGPVCVVYNADDFPCLEEEDVERVHEEAQANACLIAAAPTMSEAIEIALIYLEDGAVKTAADRLRAALAKARGQS